MSFIPQSDKTFQSLIKKHGKDVVEKCIIDTSRIYFPNIDDLRRIEPFALYILKSYDGSQDIITPAEITSLLRPKSTPANKRFSTDLSLLSYPYIIKGNILNITINKSSTLFYNKGKNITLTSLVITAPGQDNKSLYLVKDSLPKTVRYNRLQKSKWSPKLKGYVYTINRGDNVSEYVWGEYTHSLRDFIQTIEDINTAWGTDRSQLLQEGPQDKEFGILGWDVKYTPEDWVTELLPSKVNFGARAAPTKAMSGVSGKFHYKFSKSGSKCSSMAKRNSYAHKKRFERMIPAHFPFTSADACLSPRLTKYLNSKKFSSFTLSWGKHARFASINNEDKSVTIFDPWKKSISRGYWVPMENVFRQAGWTLIFDPRTRHTLAQIKEAKKLGTVLQSSTLLTDQYAGEGSCGHVAFMRAMMIAYYGEIGARLDISTDYAMASWLITSYIK